LSDASRGLGLPRVRFSDIFARAIVRTLISTASASASGAAFRRPRGGLRARIARVALAASWAATLVAHVPAASLARMAGQSGAAIPRMFGDTDVAARALDSTLVWKDLDPLMRSRHAMSKDGRAALEHMAESRLLEVMARENGLSIPAKAVDARWKDLESQIHASGDKDGIAGYLKKGRLTEGEFRHYLELSIVQETLTRRALGMDDKASLTGEQQQIWIEERLRERNFAVQPPPWKDGVAARCSSFTIGIDELVRYLRQRLPEQDIRDDCYQLLLCRRMQKRMPDLAPSKLDEYVQAELERRRSEVAADPRYKGVPYENILAAQGILADSLATDPSVLVAALSRAWVDRSYSPEALKRVYTDEREYFDGLYGDAIDTSMLFLRGAQFKNELNSRTFAEAEAKLAAWKASLRSLEDFQRLAKAESEDATTRDSGGSLGYTGTGNPRIPPEVRTEIGRALAARPSYDEAGKNPIGPVRVANGCVLLWFGMRRPAPTWEGMAAQVHRELRKRFIDEVLPKASLSTGFDGQ
jgi:hypothetical protein